MKNLFYFLSAFLLLQACSESPKTGTGPTADAYGNILADSALVLGSSPDNKFRLFRSVRKGNENGQADIVLLRMPDMKQVLVSNLPAQVNGAKYKPKSFWSKDAKYLMVDNALAEGDNPRELVLFDLTTMEVAHRQPGELLAFDEENSVVFYYRTTAERQIFAHYPLSNPGQEATRDLIAPPGDKTPIITLKTEDKEARVKAYRGGAPINFSMRY